MRFGLNYTQATISFADAVTQTCIVTKRATQ